MTYSPRYLDYMSNILLDVTKDHAQHIVTLEQDIGRKDAIIDWFQQQLEETKLALSSAEQELRSVKEKYLKNEQSINVSVYTVLTGMIH